MSDNPLLDRYRLSALRPRQAWMFGSIYCTLVLLILLGCYVREISSMEPVDWGRFAEGVFALLLLLEMAVCWFWCPGNMVLAMRNEMLRNAYDFFTLLPLSPARKAMGILVGANAFALIIAAINGLLAVIVGAVDGVPIAALLHLALVLGAGSLFLTAVCLLGALQSPRKPEMSSLIALATFVTIILGPAAFFFTVTAPAGVTAWRIPFAGLSMPTLVFASALLVYFAGWAIAGILRKLRQPSLPLFSPLGSICFSALLGLLLLGLCMPHAGPGTIALGVFVLFAMLVLLPMPFGSIGGVARYLERGRILLAQGRSDGAFIAGLFAHSNLMTGLLLFPAWVPLTLIMAAADEADMGHAVGFLAVVFSAYLFLLLLVELHTLYKPLHERITVLLAFIAVVFFVCPLILAAASESLFIASFSAFGQVVVLLGSFDDRPAPAGIVVVVNMALCVVPALLVWLRYRAILRQRRALMPTDAGPAGSAA